MATLQDEITTSIGIGFSRAFRKEVMNTMQKPEPKKVIFNNPYTIVNWKDGTKTVVKCMEGDTFSKDVGFCVAVARKVFGGHNQYKKFVKDAHVIEPKRICSCGAPSDPNLDYDWCGVCIPF